jgi:predicted RNase H-like nuclease
MKSAVAIGVDLAWSSRHPSGLAAAVIEPGAVRITEVVRLVELEDIVAWIGQHQGSATTIAVDAPLCVPNTSGMRDCERELQREFGGRHAGPYPSNRTLHRTVHGCVRGEELVDRIAPDGVGLCPAGHAGTWMLEVFPAAALVRLFGLDRGIIYKKKRGRSWAACRSGLAEYLQRLNDLTNPALLLPDGLNVTEQRGVAFKDIEDRVDAVLCAYLAGLSWLYGDARLEMFGTQALGHVVVPR